MKAYVRARPALPEELESPLWRIGVDVEDGSANWVQLRKEGEGRRHFARVWGPMSSQEDVFAAVGIPAVEDVLLGHSATILCYGQTGTGKTYTLGCQLEGYKGLIPRSIEMIFDRRAKEAHIFDTLVTIQYIHLYRDSIQDLLNPGQTDLKLVDDDGGPIVEGCVSTDCVTGADALELVNRGDENRVTANTLLSSASSRSTTPV